MDLGSSGKERRAKARSVIRRDKGPKSYQGKVIMVNPVFVLFKGVKRRTRANGNNNSPNRVKLVL